MNRTELIMRRRNVRAFILADKVEVSFVREVRTATPAGGWTVVKLPPLDPQTGRIIESKRRYAPPFVNSEAGEIPKWPYILLAFHNLDVQENDVFDWQGQTYQVKSIDPDREERTRCGVDFYGDGN